MFHNNKEVETAVHVLAVHLDGMLDIADVFLTSSFVPQCLSDRAETAEILESNAHLRGFVEELRTMELALLTKLHQARQWCQHLAKLDKNTRSSSRLFVAGTQALCDVMLQTADRSAQTFDDGDQALCYLKDRGLLATDVLSLDDIKRVRVDGSFLLCGWVPIHVFLNSLEAYLTTLDLEYRLYEPQKTENVSVKKVGSATTRDATVSIELMPEIAGDSRQSPASVPLKQSKVPSAPINVKTAPSVSRINQAVRSPNVARPSSNVPKKSTKATEVNDVAVIEPSPTESSAEIGQKQRMAEVSVQLKTGKIKGDSDSTYKPEQHLKNTADTGVKTEPVSVVKRGPDSKPVTHRKPDSEVKVAVSKDAKRAAKKRAKQELQLKKTCRTANGTGAIVRNGVSMREQGKPDAENTAEVSKNVEFERPGPVRLTSALAALKSAEPKEDREPELPSEVEKKRDALDLAAPIPVMVTGRTR